MTTHRNIVVDGSAPVWAQRLQTDLNDALAGIANDIARARADNGSATAKAWVDFNGATGAINSSFNVGSVVRNSAGTYTVTFSSVLADANYAVAGTVGGTPGVIASRVLDDVAARTASAFRIMTLNSSFAAADALHVSLVVYGN